MDWIAGYWLFSFSWLLSCQPVKIQYWSTSILYIWACVMLLLFFFSFYYNLYIFVFLPLVLYLICISCLSRCCPRRPQLNYQLHCCSGLCNTWTHEMSYIHSSAKQVRSGKNNETTKLKKGAEKTKVTRSFLQIILIVSNPNVAFWKLKLKKTDIVSNQVTCQTSRSQAHYKL